MLFCKRSETAHTNYRQKLSRQLKVYLKSSMMDFTFSCRLHYILNDTCNYLKLLASRDIFYKV